MTSPSYTPQINQYLENNPSYVKSPEKPKGRSLSTKNPYHIFKASSESPVKRTYAREGSPQRTSTTFTIVDDRLPPNQRTTPNEIVITTSVFDKTFEQPKRINLNLAEKASPDRIFKTKKRQFDFEGIQQKVITDSQATNITQSPDRYHRKLGPISPSMRPEDSVMKRLIAVNQQSSNQELLRGLKQHVEKIKDELFHDQVEAHKRFMESMKILEYSAHEIDVNHNHILHLISDKKAKQMLRLMELAEHNRSHLNIVHESEEELELMKNQLKEERVLLSQVDDIVKEKLQKRVLRKRLKKENFEEVGITLALQMRKLMERLVAKEDLEGALMVSSINKLVAIELEDIWTNYLLQIELAKKEPHKEMIKEMQQDKFTVTQQKIIINKREEDFMIIINTLQKKLDRAFEEKKKLELIIKEKTEQENKPKEYHSPTFRKKMDGNYEEIPLEVLELEALPKSKFLQDPNAQSSGALLSGAPSEGDLKVPVSTENLAISVNLSQKGPT